jgi:hypothetical protein
MDFLVRTAVKFEDRLVKEDLLAHGFVFAVD